MKDVHGRSRGQKLANAWLTDGAKGILTRERPTHDAPLWRLRLWHKRSVPNANHHQPCADQKVTPVRSAVRKQSAPVRKRHEFRLQIEDVHTISAHTLVVKEMDLLLQMQLRSICHTAPPPSCPKSASSFHGQTPLSLLRPFVRSFCGELVEPLTSASLTQQWNEP